VDLWLALSKIVLDFRQPSGAAMVEPSKAADVVRFGPFELSLDTQELRKHGVPVKLFGQAIQVLAMLAANPGKLVTREELQKKLWPAESFGDFEHGLNAAVNKLREKLGDSAATPTYVETLPGRGYRFIVQVQSPNGSLSPDAKSAIHVGEPHESEPSAVEPETPKPRWKLKASIAATGVALALGAAILTYLWMRPEPVPKVSNYVQLTYDGQRKWLVGSDGSRLYMGLGSSGIAQMSTSGGDLTGIPTPYPNPYLADVSADGAKLLVIDEEVLGRGPLWSLPVLGGVPRRLGDTEGYDAAWSPNGEMLAYTNGGDVFVAKADGAESHKVVTIKNSAIVGNPVWSPDGSHLRFDAAEGVDRPPFLWEVAVDGTNLHRLLPGMNNPPDWECCGKWTADGRYFIFRSRRQIWALPRKGGFLHSEPKPVQLTFSPLGLSAPLPSKDGKKLFVVGRTFHGELMRYDSKSGQFSPFLGGISAEYIAFSKDGQWVAYVAFPEGTLWRSKADGSERLQLTYPPGYAIWPRWSPDGKKIVFIEFFADKPSRIFEVSPQGGSLRQLMADDPNPQADPNWSTDGSKIVFAGNANDAASTVRILDLTTHQVSTLPGSQTLFGPRWSPDGRYIVAQSSDMTALHLFDFQTQKWTELAKGTLVDLNWSKDGLYFYVHDYSGTGTVIRGRLSDGKTERVVDLKNFPQTGHWGSSSLALAPDDSPLLLRDTGTQDVYALDWEEP
jgi:Tol biopolymer transport system component/DNA-binding winged helix-turn-helix (wHTH) protein